MDRCDVDVTGLCVIIAFDDMDTDLLMVFIFRAVSEDEDGELTKKGLGLLLLLLL